MQGLSPSRPQLRISHHAGLGERRKGAEQGMNHRDLMLSARRKTKSSFLALPHGLQDEIVEGLDAQTLTFREAKALAASRGHRVSLSCIHGYYAAVRRERRLLEVSCEMKRIVAEFGAQPYEKSLKSLANLIVATAAAGLADGSVGIRDINLEKVLKALPEAAQQGAKFAKPGKASRTKRPGLSAAAVDEIRRKVLGIKER
jgi:hypothetical protein